MVFLDQKTVGKSIKTFDSRIFSLEILTLIRMTKDEKGLAFFKGLLL